MRLLVLVLLVGCGWAAACPENCSCAYQQGLLVANCSSLPYNGGKIEALTLLPARASPLELSDGQFNAARHLKYLDLKNCSIYFIHKKALYGAKNIIEIDLSFNYIEELEPTVFQHLKNLTSLILRGNPIQFVSEVPFLISNSLQHLDVGQCKIKNVPRGIFYGLKRLRYLSMDGNFLKTLKYNSLPKVLKYLNISKNLIINVPTEVLSALTNLRRIGLVGNPINCSCTLLNFQDWLSGRGVIFEDDVKCSLPLEYRGVSWGKVDENKLCLAEARREEFFESTKNDPLLKNKLNKNNDYEDVNGFLGERLQSDQPQPSLLDPQAEVLFQNDDTLAMGEMMRDEEETTKTDELYSKKSPIDESDIESATIKKDQESADIETPDPQEIEINLEKEKSEDGKAENNKEESVLSLNDYKTDSLTNNNEGNAYLNVSTENQPSEVTVQENKVEGQDKSSQRTTGGIHDNVESKENVNLENSSPVVYTEINKEESNPDVDDFREEGLFHVDTDKLNIKVDTNETSEESTAIPDIEETTDDEVASTLETYLENEKMDALSNNLTSSTEITNSTISEDTVKSEEDEITETVPPPVIISDLQSHNETQESADINNVSTTDITPPADLHVSKSENDSLLVPAMTRDNKAEPVKEIAGAEVVMFCIAVIIICLMLYSVYKCRTSNKRQSLRVVKDAEANRGTEMQDMASLLPKPEEDQSNNKYPDKKPSSETVKLISDKNEKENSNFTPTTDIKNNVENKNSFNNNTPSNPTSKTPLIKPENPITINPTSPIQRTKVKVGIIPDSIPRTPIFLQKSYNNGTKNV